MATASRQQALLLLTADLHIDVEYHFQEVELLVLPHTTHASSPKLLNPPTSINFDPTYYHMTHAYDGNCRAHLSLQNLSLEENGKQPATDTQLARLIFGKFAALPQIGDHDIWLFPFLSGGSFADMIESWWKNAPEDLISEKSNPFGGGTWMGPPKSAKSYPKALVNRLQTTCIRRILIELLAARIMMTHNL